MRYLLETDQVHCYSEEGEPISCRDSGQDAAYAKRFFMPAPGRFQVSGQVVKDKLARVSWTRNANPAVFPLSWQEALQYVMQMRAQRAHGCSHWQLPSRNLLFSLISHQQKNPALPADAPFEDIFTGYYWTSEGCSRLTDQAWYIHMGGGRVQRGMKHGSYMVWPVSPDATGSSGPDLPGSDRFVAHGDCVHDTTTGLTWRRDADPARKKLTWAAALAFIRELNGNTAVDESCWRLPNVRELESLIDLSSHSPALTPGHSFINVRDAYWSSTTSIYEPRYAWTLYCRDGAVGVGFKPRAEFHAWPVRS